MNIARRSLLSGAALVVVATPVNASKINNLQGTIDKAIEEGGVVQLPAGTFATAGLKINGAVNLQGVPGATKLVSLSGGPVLIIDTAEDVTVSGINFIGKTVPSTDELAHGGLLVARRATNLRIQNCAFSGSPFTGLRLENCSGVVRGNRFSKLGDFGLFAINAVGLEINGNVVSDIGNNGIAVWRSEAGEDGTLVCNNRVSHVRADAGGNGQNGNGINIYLAGNVMTANNRVSDTAFSSIRYNSGSNAQIVGNNLSRAGEVSLYVEFAFQGAVIANNSIDGAGTGISITNFDVGGRLATCTGNLIRNIQHGSTAEAGLSYGIWAEADTVVSHNVLEEIGDVGIWLGFGPHSRNLSAQGNIVRKTKLGIVVSTTAGTGNILVTGNMIESASKAAIQGFDYREASTKDLSLAGAKVPPHVLVTNNMVSRQP